MAALFLSESDVAALADMPLALQAVASAHRALAEGLAQDYPRQRVRSEAGMLHLLQGGLFDARRVTGFKTYTTTRNAARFWLHLFDADSGDPLAVIEADHLGMLRTGAAAGLAAQCLARPDAQHAVIFGAGWQARGQLMALAAVRPLAPVIVFARDPVRLRAFCEEMTRVVGVPVVPGEDVEAAVRKADIVVTMTTSPKPLFDGHWLAAGTHVTAAGSNALIRREIDEVTVTRAACVAVDSRATALREAGDLLPALEKGTLIESRLVELGELLAGFRPGRRTEGDITLFVSQGMAIQDLALGAEILHRARATGRGAPLPY